MIATARLDSDDLEILRDAKHDRVARARPGQLAERKQLVATRTPSPIRLKEAADLAAAVATATRDVDAAQRALDRARDQLSDAWRRQHGHSHGVHGSDQAARSRLRALTHPAVPVVVSALTRAGYDAMSAPMSVLGVEEVKEELPLTAEESRRPSWFRPRIRETLRPVTSHASQVSFLEAIGLARASVENLAYADLTDDATVEVLRVELDNVLRIPLPTNFHHVRDPLVVLRNKLAGDPLSLWTIAEEVIA